MSAYAAVHAKFYDATDGKLTKDVEFYVRAALASAGPVLELGCGTGRILLPTASAGVHIVGLDSSPAMLASCANKLRAMHNDIQQHIQLECADMTTFERAEKFGLVSIPHRSFQHLLSSDDQRTALARIRARMSDKARLVFNIFDPMPEMIAACSGHLSGIVRKVGADFTHPQNGNRMVQLDSTVYEPATQLITIERFYDEFNHAGERINRHGTVFQLRFTYRFEMQYLLALCGFKVEALYGGFEQEPFRAGGEQVWVATKA